MYTGEHLAVVSTYRQSCVFVHNAFWRHVQKSDVQNFNSMHAFYKGGSVSGELNIL